MTPWRQRSGGFIEGDVFIALLVRPPRVSKSNDVAGRCARAPKVVIDWDGTVTEEDTLSSALRHFVPPATLDPLTKRVDAALAAGHMTLQEVMDAEFSTMTAPVDAVVEFIAGRIAAAANGWRIRFKLRFLFGILSGESGLRRDPLNIDRMTQVWLELQMLESEYWYDVDTNSGRTAHAFYVANGTFTIGEKVFEGRDEVNRFYIWRQNRGARTSRHVYTNPRVSNLTETTARFECIMSLYAQDGEPILESKPAIMIADVINDYALQDGAWKLESRVLRPIFEGGVPATVPK